MKIKIILLGMLLLSFNLISQDRPVEFGKLNPEDLQLQQYDKDPEAEAVILFDKGESSFFEKEVGNYIQLYIRFTRTKRIKILDNAGVKYAEVTIPYYSEGYGSSESINDLEAHTYNIENNQVIKTELDKKAVFEEQINERWHVKKFAFPNVKKGSIIEFTYELQTPFHFNLPDWEFQSRIPTLYSEYVVKLTPFYEYVFIAQGITKFDYHNSELSLHKRRFRIVNGAEYKDMVHTYIMKDVPAFKDEAYITSANDYIMKLDFQLSKYHSPRGGSREIMSTWSALNDEFLKHDKIGKYIKKSGKYAGQILESELKLQDGNDLEKAEQIINYVKKSFRWNGSQSKYASKTPKEFIETKTGNIANINLFLISMLNEAGIEAHPVISSTRDHKKLNINYPFEHFFNYLLVLVKVGNQSFLTDASEPLLSFTRIPTRCINEQGLVLKKEGSFWVDLYNNLISLDNKTMNIDIDAEALTANVRVNSQSTEFLSYEVKRKFLNDSVKIEEDLLKNGFIEVGNISTLNYNRPNLPYVINYEGTINIDRIGNKLAVSQFLGFPIRENKLIEKTRSYPIDMVFAQSRSLISTVTIPEGYKVISIPESFKVDNDLATVKLEFQSVDNVVKGSAVYSFKKAVYEPHEYARIKHYIDNIVKRFNEQVVFEKI
ncbi:MAG: DUF3857 and transglutaminase domain-containing protein [Candidatus Cyclobacteriaceae bacterium M2_1C_046]